MILVFVILYQLVFLKKGQGQRSVKAKVKRSELSAKSSSTMYVSEYSCTIHSDSSAIYLTADKGYKEGGD